MDSAYTVMPAYNEEKHIEDAISQGADYIFQTDFDGLTSPAEFAAFGSRRLQHDAILGDRKVRGDGEIGASVEHIVCALLKLYFTVSAPEANAPFRLMKSSVVKKYIDRLSQDYNLANNMLTTYFACYKEKPIFRKVSFKVRRARQERQIIAGKVGIGNE